MDKVLILDFGSQFTQLIARRVRELGVYSEILPANSSLSEIKGREPKGIILSGGPHSVFDSQSPQATPEILTLGLPLLGICYGMQWLAHVGGGKVEKADNREYGFMSVKFGPEIGGSPLLAGFPSRELRTWMSHGDEVRVLPPGFRPLGKSLGGSLAAMEDIKRKWFALQFHPEVTHTERGIQFFRNFINICGARSGWSIHDFVGQKVREIQDQLGPDEHAICALSGGVDSTVAATMVEKAIPGRLDCLYIESGLQRSDESKEVMASFARSGLRVERIDATEKFLSVLKGVADPEAKRKAIGRAFIEVFQAESERLARRHGKDQIQWLVQGTLYPDVIESMPPPGRGGFSATIKSHHNVGGLPENMSLKLLEPLRELFKDEVRSLGKELGVDPKILERHPFPGPGLAVRCLGEVNKERLDILRAADKIFIEEIRAAGLYHEIWQAGVVLLPIQTVGVMGDGRTYQWPVALRAVTSQDGMTADWYRFPQEVLAKISHRIVNEVSGVNRVVYDISSKPPSTIEWE